MLVRICFIFFIATSFSFAQTININSVDNKKLCNSDSSIGSKIEPKRLLLATSGLVLINWGVYQPFKDVWWNEKRTNFHLYRGYRRTEGYWDFGWYDSFYAHLDKLGHIYSSRLLADLFTDISNWVGFNTSSSRLIGPMISFTLMLEIEIYDSFFKEWGFSLADFTANCIGAFSPIWCDKYPFFNCFKLKLSYHPSDYCESEKNYIKDYAGMTFWLSYDINRNLPKKIESYWPDFMNIAIGYGVDQPYRGNVELYLAPDINWQKVINSKNGRVNRILKFLNYFHFPCITWQLTPKNRFYFLYF